MASGSFVSSKARQECAGREDAGCPEYFTYLPPSAGRVRIFCRPFWRWYGGRRGVLILDRSNNDTADGGAYNGGCLVNYWGKTYGRSSKIDDDGDDAFGRRGWLASQLFTCGGDIVVGRQLGFALSVDGWARARCRDDEAAFVAAVELGWLWALRLCAAATSLPRSCPATPAHFSLPGSDY